jgi:carbamate kinase
MLVVIALGGNALARRGERLDAGVQRHNAAAAAAAIAEVASRHRVVLTHGNGPQVGLLALQAAAYRDVGGVEPYPLDVLGAESEGMVGYVLEQELGRHLGPDRMATLLTQVVVDASDPAFGHPTKPIGPVYAEVEGARLAAARGWTMVRDGGGVRRVVASPEPRALVELAAIRILVEAGATVICAGGGGIPVVRTKSGLRGVEAVVDKDLSAAMLAGALGADALVLLTDVAAVWERWPRDGTPAIRVGGVEELRALRLAAGSMGPKVEAACRFAAAGGAVAAIGGLTDAAAVLAGRAGTRVVAGPHPLDYDDRRPADGRV